MSEPRIRSIADITDATGTKKYKLTPGGTANTRLTLASAQTADRTITFPDATDTLVGRATTDTFTNKTITATTNNVAANSLKSTTGLIDVAAATAPSSGQVLTATSSTTATWQTPSSAATGGNLVDTSTFIVDTTDATKRIGFDASGTTATTTTITAAQTADRTITLPNATDTLVGRATTDTLTNKTLTTPIISSISNTGTITLPTTTDTLVGRITTDTLTNKTITAITNNVAANSLKTATGVVTVSAATAPTTGQILTATAGTTATWQNPSGVATSGNLVDTSTFVVDATDATKRIGFDAGGTTATTTTLTAAQTANRVLTLPDATDTLVGRATTDTLTNKTLTTPIISSISNTGTITLPTATDTLIARATTDTLTNKTITATSNNVAANSLKSATGVVDTAAATAPTSGQALVATSGTTATWQTVGNVAGPGTTVVNRVATWNNTSGTLLAQTSAVTIDASDNISGARTLSFASDTARSMININGIAVMRYEEANANIFIGTSAGPSSAGAGSSNTSLGYHATRSLTSGANNTVMGSVSMDIAAIGNDNTMLGFATGITGTDMTDNTFIGSEAGRITSATILNCTAVGRGAFRSGSGNGTISLGRYAGQYNGGVNNIAIGNNITWSSAGGNTGQDNVFIGNDIGGAATSASGNVFIRTTASTLTPSITTGTNNTICGIDAGHSLTSGVRNAFFGYNAGRNITTTSDNINISNAGVAGDTTTIRIGTAATHNKCLIAGIRGITTVNANAINVLIDSAGQLGTVSSSIKYKTDIADLTNSDVIYNMNPKSFRYLSNDPTAVPSIGLIAEEVEPVYPDMVIYQDDEILTLDYNRLPILLLAEVKKLRAELTAANAEIAAIKAQLVV